MGSWPVNGASLEANPDLVDHSMIKAMDFQITVTIHMWKKNEKHPLNPMNRSFYYRDTIGFSNFFSMFILGDKHRPPAIRHAQEDRAPVARVQGLRVSEVADCVLWSATWLGPGKVREVIGFTWAKWWLAMSREFSIENCFCYKIWDWSIKKWTLTSWRLA